MANFRYLSNTPYKLIVNGNIITVCAGDEIVEDKTNELDNNPRFLRIEEKKSKKIIKGDE